MNWPHTRARIRAVDHRWFAFDESGAWATVCMVDEDYSDAVAWFDQDPETWWWAIDPSTAPILNREHIDRAIFMGEPVRLYSTPAAFLAGGGNGAVLLDTAAYIAAELADVRRLIVDRPALYERIRSAFPPPPQIRINGEAHLAAA